MTGTSSTVGELHLEVVHTPGHTPHHLSYVVHHGDEPPAAFTGGSLLLGSVGRTDLVGDDVTDELTRAQYRSAHLLADRLPDDAVVYPTHGFGSFCSSGGDSDDSDGTMGTERKVNIALTVDDEDDFVERLVSGLSSYPRYYAYMGPRNRSGGGPVDLTLPAPVDPAELSRRIHRGEWVVDLRKRRAFAAEHLAGTISIELAADPFSTYLGWLLPWGTPVTLVADDPDAITEAQREMARIGIDRPMGAATGDGPDVWAPEHERRSYEAVDFKRVGDELDDITVLDVRRHDERAEGGVDGSVHIPIEELQDRMDELPDDTLWVHCASGFRANIVASLLDRAGHPVVLIDDDYDKAEELGLTSESP